MIASAGEAPVHGSLSYELPAPSTAVVDRKQHNRAYPSSASSLSKTGTQTVRIRLGGEDFIDPSSIRLQYTLNNTSGANMKPHVGAHGAWGQVFCRSGGVELDNIQNFARFYQQYVFNHATREEQFGALGVESLAVSQADDYGKPHIADINAEGSITVMHRLPLSLLSAGKLLPCKYAPLEIELSLLNDVNDWLLANDGNALSQSFTLSDIQILYNSFHLDEAVLQSFYSALLRNKVMSIATMNAHQMVFPMSTAPTQNFTSVRAFSRLSQVWLTFRRTGPRSKEFMCPGDLPGVADVANHAMTNTQVPTARLSIGPANWPNPQPAASVGEYYNMLMNALGQQPNINRKCFEEDSFTIVWDLRKMPQDPTSAISTRSGDQVHIQLSNLSNGATECWVTLISFQVVAIRESGISVLS